MERFWYGQKDHQRFVRESPSTVIPSMSCEYREGWRDGRREGGREGGMKMGDGSNIVTPLAYECTVLCPQKFSGGQL